MAKKAAAKKPAPPKRTTHDPDKASSNGIIPGNKNGPKPKNKKVLVTEVII